MPPCAALFEVTSYPFTATATADEAKTFCPLFLIGKVQGFLSKGKHLWYLHLQVLWLNFCGYLGASYLKCGFLKKSLSKGL